MSETKPGIDMEKMGAPKTEEESVFLSTPELSFAADKAVEFQNLNSEKRRKLIDKISEDIVDNPDRLPEFFDALEMLGEVGSYKIENFKQDVEKGLERVKIKHFPPSAEVMQKWLTLYTENDLYKGIAENLLTKMFGRCQDIKSTVNFLYNLTLAGVQSSNPHVVRKFLEIMGFQTKMYAPSTKPAINLSAAFFDLDDDTLQKALDIDTVYDIFARLSKNDDLVEEKRKSVASQLGNEEYGKILRETRSTNPERFRALIRFYDSIPTGTRGASEEEMNKWPLNLTLTDTPLRVIINESIANERGLPNLSFPDGRNLVVQDPDIIKEIIIKQLNSDAKGAPNAESEKLWKTLSYLVPESMHDEQKIKDLDDLNEQTKTDMRYNTKYLLSPRGDRIDIDDPVLTELGFSHILFEMDKKKKRDTIVTIPIGNFKYRAVLDEYFALQEIGKKAGINLGPNGAFLQNVILSHLHEIRCTEKAIEESAGEEGDAQKMFLARRAHLRRLPVGQSPTKEQIMRAMATYDIDIVRINREARGEERKRTFVFDTEVLANTGVGPVVSKAPDATKQLQEILNK